MPFKVKWALSLELKHAIYCNLCFSVKKGHQPGYVMTYIKQEVMYAETILQFQYKRSWAVEETNISIQNIYIRRELQEGRSLPQFWWTFVRNSEKAL